MALYDQIRSDISPNRYLTKVRKLQKIPSNYNEIQVWSAAWGGFLISHPNSGSKRVIYGEKPNVWRNTVLDMYVGCEISVWVVSCAVGANTRGMIKSIEATIRDCCALVRSGRRPLQKVYYLIIRSGTLLYGKCGKTPYNNLIITPKRGLL